MKNRTVATPTPTESAAGVADYPDPAEGDFVLKDFTFASGETLPEARIHYRTVGQPARDREGQVHNAVLILHGTGGQGGNFVRKGLPDEVSSAVRHSCSASGGLCE